MHRQWNLLLTEVEERIKGLTVLQKALKTLSSPDVWDTPRVIVGACRVLSEGNPVALGLGWDLSALLEDTRKDQRGRAAERRMAFGRALREQAEERGSLCTLLTSDPMEFSLPPFSLEVDLEENTALLRYARLPLETLQAGPAKILAACDRWRKALSGGWPPEGFFDALHWAYEVELLRTQGRKGDRVALVRCLPHVALESQAEKFRRDPCGAHYRDYGRAHLAWDLARLRTMGLLQKDGQRLNLGTATGASTSDKAGVLYLEEETGRGQYYLTLWFSPVS